MPSTTIPHRRRRAVESDEEEEDGVASGTATPTSQRSTGSKRVRLNLKGDASPVAESPVLPDGFRARPDESVGEEVLDARGAMEKHQPGSIVRVKLTNFVTYTSAEFFPGPSLNMVIGPNGTGKSTLVCAICLGLGWTPAHLGRAKDAAEFVKHGSQEATIEIELAADPERSRKNPVIRRSIKREGNKSHFSINGKPSNMKGVLELARSFSIQIDNLCQFLPQDKVVEFAAMTPVELLHSTQRAAAPEEMLGWHSLLKTYRGNQKTMQAQYAGDQETLANLESRQQMQRADVERLQERAKIQQRVKMLEVARPFAKYREARKRHQEAKQKRKDAVAALKELENEVEPSLRAVNAKQRYREQIEVVVKERKRAVERADVAAEDLTTKMRNMQDKIQEFEQEKQAENNRAKENKKEIATTEHVIMRLRRQMEEQPNEFNVSSYNEQIREKAHSLREIKEKAEALQRTQEDLTNRGRERNALIMQARKDLESLESQAGQQAQKLRQASRDTAQAWGWIQQNQDKFEKPVFGPPIVECSVKDLKYVDAIESIFQSNDFLAFTVQTRGDFKLLQEQLYGRMKLAEINIRTVLGGLDQFRPPVSEQDMGRYGFEGWALDFVTGPEPVLAMLCGECRLHQTGIALRDITEQQYEVLTQSPISSWVTGKNTYQITRRREYGAGAASTRVRDVRKARVWTNQPVDLRAKSNLQENIEGWGEEVSAFQKQTQQAKEKVAQLRLEYVELENEKTNLEQEKAAKQKALGEFKALPTKLAQQEEKQATLQHGLTQVRQRLLQITEKEDALTMEKGQVALDYVNAVQILRELHNDLLQAEVMLLEGASELEILTERNRAVKDMLEAKRKEVDDVAKDSEKVQAMAKRLLDECKEIMASDDEDQREFLSSMPEGQTTDELEAEIDSEKARLELMYEGNSGAIKEFEHRQKKIDQLKQKVADVERHLAEIEEGINDLRQKWEPELDRLVKKISDAFSYSFKQINCAGEVGIHKDEDFDQWSIQIQVKFRESESLSILDSHRQSGGERAVSTIFYLMALQSLARAPFRVVDEINQGMDPRNERMVHSRMVNIACQEHTSQYFLITPKLLHGLQYDRRMRVMCIASGEFMPKEYRELDFGRCVDVMRGVKAGA
ncbi:MAG: Structural maintenance of chromosomes protein 5 [Pleopsidium flavum]|nr:MAG: Structural maintenance of chromosomes protein 5 [Pleopsidium flavum]